MDKNIVIAGGTGFLGQALTEYFQSKNWKVSILTRNPQAANQIAWNGKELGKWSDCLENCDVLINLCGKSVDCRYTAKNKQAILDSRLLPTQLLNKAISKSKNPPKIFLNASSATAYVHSKKRRMTEKNGVIGHDFSMSVVREWEEAFFATDHPKTRKVALRTSIVLGDKGGAYPKLRQITRLGLGGKQGSGNQMVSWISELDFCKAIDHIIHTRYLEGAINITSPEPLSNAAFMKALRTKIKPLFSIHQPKWLLELGAIFMRTETELLLKSRNVLPERLLGSGFEFSHKSISSFLTNEID